MTIEKNAANSAREYHIVTISDAFREIPADRIDDFLSDLGGMMKHHKEIEKALSELSKTQVTTDLKRGFVWIDDGKRDLKLVVR